MIGENHIEIKDVGNWVNDVKYGTIHTYSELLLLSGYHSKNPYI